MWKVDAHSHVGSGAAVWSGQDVVDRMDTMKVDKTIIFPFTEGRFACFNIFFDIFLTFSLHFT